MKFSTLLLYALALSACADRQASTDRATTDTAPSTMAISDEQRRVTEDSVKAWLKMVEEAYERGDSAALMNTYVPTGDLVTVHSGMVFTVRDSAEKSLKGLSQLTDRECTFRDPKIDVLAPGVAAVTLLFRFAWKAKGKPEVDEGVWSAALAVRDGRLRVIQEHASSPPKSEK